MKVAEVSHVPKLRVNLLSISTLADKGHAVMFKDGHVLIRSERMTLDATMRLGTRQCMMHMFLGQPVLGSNGFMDLDYVLERGQVARERVDTRDSILFQDSHRSQ
jgi:hypothetical protein